MDETESILKGLLSGAPCSEIRVRAKRGGTYNVKLYSQSKKTSEGEDDSLKGAFVKALAARSARTAANIEAEEKARQKTARRIAKTLPVPPKYVEGRLALGWDEERIVTHVQMCSALGVDP